ncbi:MAG: hypothetical protein OQL09_05255 [Gammaproteobacteria bacterium]|nr:hypothetical protein [Gammaproteobacteria bacterium]
MSQFIDFVLVTGILAHSKILLKEITNMNKFSTVALGGLLAAAMSSSVYAEPTRTFFTETADIAPNGSVSLDLDYGFDDIAGGTGIRIGALGGEILLNNTQAGQGQTFVASSIGYKKVLQKNLSAYGIISYVNDDVLGSYTDFAIGAAYTIKQKDLTININGEILSDDTGVAGFPPRGGDTTLFVKGAIKLPIDNVLPNSSLIAEVALEDNDLLETQSAFGVRWEPSKRVTADLIVYVDEGTTDTIGLPGYIKLNLAF